MTPTEQKIKMAETQCMLANQRFGLKQGLRFILSRFNCNDVAVEHIIDLAANRNIHELKDFMEGVNTIDSGKPRHVRIMKPEQAWGKK